MVDHRMVQIAARTHWKTIEEWNKKYVVRTFSNQDEYQCLPVESTERDWDLYSTDYKATVAKMLVENILGPYDWAAKVRFTNTGSEAVEVASIIAKLYTGKQLTRASRSSRPTATPPSAATTATLPCASSSASAWRRAC